MQSLALPAFRNRTMKLPTPIPRWRVLFVCVIAFVPASVRADVLTFEKDVRPILKAYCLDCHGGGEKVAGKLDLRLKRFIEQGGSNGPALVVKDPVKSLIIERMKSGEMPPTEKKVPPAQIAIIEQWIANGATINRPEPEKLPPGIDITPEDRAYWFYQPLQRPTVPTTAAHPIDAFIVAKLREKNLDLSAEADKRTLIRRATFDLSGLPPTPEEVAAFVADSSSDAYEKLLDRLLASPRYGERWGRHWLDVAGYADSDGDGTTDTVRPYAWKYRDYVIRAMNSDKPFNQFIIEQLAGDELVPAPWKNLTAEQIDQLAATGFLRMAPDPTTSNGDTAPLANQVVGDTLRIVSTSLLGLSVGCAQCHDHRYDPIPQVDYFRFRAVFEPALDPANWRRSNQRHVSLYTDADRAKSDAINAEVQKLQGEYNIKQSKFMDAALEKELLKHPEHQRVPLREAYKTPADKRNPEQKKLLELHPSVNLNPGVLYQYDAAAADELKRDQASIAAKQALRPIEDFVAVTNETPGSLPKTHLFYRGDYRAPKQVITPGDLTIAAPDGARFEIPEKDPKLATSGRRLAYARHLTSGKHPLVGRVLANRIWLQHFGRGIVDTPGEFGLLGVRPTHPALLDFLAVELAERGWSLKSMHKLIMTSRVYRQSSVMTPNTTDRDNQFYSRFPLRRLEAEAIRDHILSVSGLLDDKAFGPPIPIVEDFVGQVIAQNDSPRRSIYLQVRRTKPVSLLSAFDAAGTAVNCDRRISSTAAPQSLMLMNSDFVLKNAELFAKRLREQKPTLTEQISLAWSIAYQRPISPEESAAVTKFLEKQTAHHADAKTPNPDFHALVNLCQQLMCSNEFLYVD